MEKINEKLYDIITNHISIVFGIQTMKILEFYLEKHGIKIDKIGDNIEEFEDALYSLFGNGAELIIKEIIKMLYNAYNIEISREFNNLKEALLLLKQELD